MAVWPGDFTETIDGATYRVLIERVAHSDGRTWYCLLAILRDGHSVHETICLGELDDALAEAWAWVRAQHD